MTQDRPFGVKSSMGVEDSPDAPERRLFDVTLVTLSALQATHVPCSCVHVYRYFLVNYLDFIIGYNEREAGCSFTHREAMHLSLTRHVSQRWFPPT